MKWTSGPLLAEIRCLGYTPEDSWVFLSCSSSQEDPNGTRSDFEDKKQERDQYRESHVLIQEVVCTDM